MRATSRWLAAAVLVVALPILAQDKNEDRKPPEKKPDEKKVDDKKEPAKKEVPKYKSVNKIVIRVSEVDTKEMTISVGTGFGPYARRTTYKLADDVVVRRHKPVERKDELGRAVKYTAEELHKLKGKDRTQPGYEAELNSLKEGQVVEIELSVRRPLPGAPPKKKGEEEKPFATRVIIQEEARAMDGRPREKK